MILILQQNAQIYFAMKWEEKMNVTMNWILVCACVTLFLSVILNLAFHKSVD